MPTTLNRARLLADATEYHYPTHSMAAPDVLGFRRSTQQAAHRYHVKRTFAKLDPDGVAYPENLIIEVSVRRPFAFTDAEHDACVANILDVLSNATLMTELKTGRLVDDDSISVGI